MTTFSPISISSFKAYDIRGELGVNLDENIAYRIGRAFAEYLNPNQQKQSIVIGADIRPSSETLKKPRFKGF